MNNSFDVDLRGLEKFSLVEWPGKISAIIFTGGCNFRCPFCHNPELVQIDNSKESINPPVYPWSEIEKFLNRKVGWVDAVMITGGEPTIHSDLPKLLLAVKNKGFLVGLATNGTNPEMLKKLMEEKLLDRICMDVKSSLARYSLVVGLTKEGSEKKNFDSLEEKIQRSLELIKNSGLDYDFKLTLVPGLVNPEDIPAIGEMIKGAKKLTVQQFRPLRTLDKSYENKVPYTLDEMKKIVEVLRKYVNKVEGL